MPLLYSKRSVAVQQVTGGVTFERREAPRRTAAARGEGPGPGVPWFLAAPREHVAAGRRPRRDHRGECWATVWAAIVSASVRPMIARGRNHRDRRSTR